MSPKIPIFITLSRDFTARGPFTHFIESERSSLTGQQRVFLNVVHLSVWGTDGDPERAALGVDNERGSPRWGFLAISAKNLFA